MLHAVRLIRRTEIRQEVVVPGRSQFRSDALDFFFVLLRRVRLVENVIFLVLQIHTAEAVAEVFAEGAEFTVAAVMCVKAEVAGVA